MMSLLLQDAMTALPIAQLADLPLPVVWELSETGLHVYFGIPEVLRLFRYFLPRGFAVEGRLRS